MTTADAVAMEEQNLVRVPHASEVANEEKEQNENNERYLLFLINNETFGIDILKIKEIIEYPGVSIVPMMPDHIRGVMNLRGNVVPVIDLGRRLGRISEPVGKRTCVVIVETNFEEDIVEIGIVVDAVKQVFETKKNDIEPPSPFGANVRADFIFGMSRMGEGSHILLDLDRVLDIEELSSFDTANESTKHSEYAE